MKHGPMVYGVLLAAMLACSGCTSMDSARLSPDPDQALARAVMDRISLDPMMKNPAISASSSGGVVTLRGVVTDDAQRSRALSITRSTPGVSRVVDQTRSY